MTFGEAIRILMDRQGIQEEQDDGADLVLDAAHEVVTEVARYCRHSTAGLADWIESGEYTGSETPQSIAAEWDKGTDE